MRDPALISALCLFLLGLAACSGELARESKTQDYCVEPAKGVKVCGPGKISEAQGYTSIYEVKSVEGPRPTEGQEKFCCYQKGGVETCVAGSPNRVTSSGVPQDIQACSTAEEIGEGYTGPRIEMRPFFTCCYTAHGLGGY